MNSGATKRPIILIRAKVHHIVPIPSLTLPYHAADAPVVERTFPFKFNNIEDRWMFTGKTDDIMKKRRNYFFYNVFGMAVVFQD